MELNRQIAQCIVKRTMAIIHRSVNVMDENGVIIASGDISRLNQKHTGAIIALRQNQMVEIDDELARRWNFEARAGINLPIHYLGKNWGVVGISGKPDQVKAYAELVKMTAELIIEQHILLEKAQWQRRFREEFILELIKGEQSPSLLQQQAQFFDFDLTLPRVVILIKLPQSTATQLQELVTYLEQSDQQHSVAVLDLAHIVILKPLATMEHFKATSLFPQKRIPTGYKISVSALDTNLTIDMLYRTAKATLAYGITHFPKKSCYVFQQYRLPALLNELTDSWQANELLKSTEVLYQTADHMILIKTLHQYFLSNCDPVHTAKKLFVHPNTLRYRLAKIEQITGLSFNNIEEKFILYLSTVLDSSCKKS